MTDTTAIPAEAIEAAAKWFSHWLGASSIRKRDREYAAEALAGAAPILLAAGRAAAVADLERAGSPLCTCPADNVPCNPETGKVMNHHCDCAAVEAAATLFRAYSRTEHARQCVHTTELDASYAVDPDERRPSL